MTSKTLGLVMPAFGAALIAAASQLTIPLGSIPFTLQTLAVGLVATLFQKREAVLSLLLYLFLGAVGLPVFAGGSGGLAALIGPAAGFLWGFLAYAALTSALVSPKSSALAIFFANLLGDSLTFVLGMLGLMFLAKMSAAAAFLSGVLPFILPDLGKLAIITFLAKALSKTLKNEGYFK
ncbi:biotin transporter BioY [Streptococcus pantholopis]|uniref:Biotin transporter n=1 Tax=Streptococcus pantholopis TaxID=1811193 RepID=A0A172Q6B1_9STRE|nr:biotin transporter BioY [Streptococcus pantholopis]AND78998.1 BioY family transporter [Streptococcus pantholopis]